MNRYLVTYETKVIYVFAMSEALLKTKTVVVDATDSLEAQRRLRLSLGVTSDQILKVETVGFASGTEGL